MSYKNISISDLGTLYEWHDNIGCESCMKRKHNMPLWIFMGNGLYKLLFNRKSTVVDEISYGQASYIRLSKNNIGWSNYIHYDGDRFRK